MWLRARDIDKEQCVCLDSGVFPTPSLIHNRNHLFPPRFGFFIARFFPFSVFQTWQTSTDVTQPKRQERHNAVLSPTSTSTSVRQKFALDWHEKYFLTDIQAHLRDCWVFFIKIDQIFFIIMKDFALNSVLLQILPQNHKTILSPTALWVRPQGRHSHVPDAPRRPFQYVYADQHHNNPNPIIKRAIIILFNGIEILS